MSRLVCCAFVCYGCSLCCFVRHLCAYGFFFFLCVWCVCVVCVFACVVLLLWRVSACVFVCSVSNCYIHVMLLRVCVCLMSCADFVGDFCVLYCWCMLLVV